MVTTLRSILKRSSQRVLVRMRPIRALRHRDRVVRAQAAERLAGSPGEQTVSALIKALRDKRVEVRAAAARSLGLLSDRRAIEPLVKLLNGEKLLSDDSHEVRALVALRPEKAIPILLSLLKRRSSAHRSSTLLSDVADILGEMRGRLDVKDLERLAKYERKRAQGK